jgi:hypothetical protein
MMGCLGTDHGRCWFDEWLQIRIGGPIPISNEPLISQCLIGEAPAHARHPPVFIGPFLPAHAAKVEKEIKMIDDKSCLVVPSAYADFSRG